MNELTHVRLSFMCCEPWQLLKMWRLKKRIKELEAIFGHVCPMTQQKIQEAYDKVS